ncbi:MAG: ATP-binding protein [Clostridium sp.]|jgi:predicted AAA+ superfamily ATPase
METKRKNQMILYRNLKYQSLFDDMCSLLDPEEDGPAPDAYACANQLIELAVTYGFQGNLWHCFLAFCMANHENAYSTSCEIVGPVQGTLAALAGHDFAGMRRLFSLDIGSLDKEPGGIWESMKHYENPLENSRAFNHRIRQRIVDLAVSLSSAESDAAFQKTVTEFYRGFGVGKFGLNKAFHIRMDEGVSHVDIEPITRVEHISLDDLVGYELQKAKLIENTEAFIEGRAANNVLLFGDSGTGKSSSIKAILNQYYDRGLRMIEVYKHQFRGLSDVLEQIKDRNYKFIIYMDDLSFEEYEIEYKYLKAIIEGGLGIKPQNVLIYATSNRRHLIRESFRDKRELDEDLHKNDTVQEKLSLVARFGVTIYYGSPEKKEFQKIVRVLAKRYHVEMPEEELLLEANKWELSHGGLSGRTASQFITHLLGKAKGEEGNNGN